MGVLFIHLVFHFVNEWCLNRAHCPLSSEVTTRGSPSQSPTSATQASRSTKSHQCPTRQPTTRRSSKSTGKIWVSRLHALPWFLTSQYTAASPTPFSFWMPPWWCANSTFVPVYICQHECLKWPASHTDFWHVYVCVFAFEPRLADRVLLFNNRLGLGRRSLCFHLSSFS